MTVEPIALIKLLFAFNRDVFLSRLSVFILLFVFSYQLIAQNNLVLKYYIVDEEKNPIEFCTIIPKSDHKGVYSNNEGYFEIFVNPNDTLLFSHISYQSKTISVSDLIQQKSDTLFLSNRSVPIKEVDISPQEFELIKYKNRKRGSYSFSGSPAYVIAFHLDNHQGGLLQEVTFYLKNPSANANVFAALRLIEKNKVYTPEDQLLDTNLVFKVKRRKLKIDLSNYYIKIPENGILIGLEFIPNPSYKKVAGKDRLSVEMIGNISKAQTYSGTLGMKWGKFTFKHESEIQNLQISYKVLVPKKEESD